MKAGLKIRWLALLLALILAATQPCRADGASDWDKDTRSAMRLIAGATEANSPGALRAGIQMQLEPGWHTYWRYPGDSGVPPRFDFAESDNVKSATVLWPAPQRFPDGAGGYSIGYTGTVIFPVHVVPLDAGKPVTLRLKADYAICETVCIPAEGKVALKLSAGPSLEEPALAAAEARVPKPAMLGGAGPLAIRAIRRDATGTRERVIVDVAAPEGARTDLFAEGPTPEWALPLPKPQLDAPAGTRRFIFDVDGVPPGTKIEGALLKLTLIAGDDALEVSTPLD